VRLDDLGDHPLESLVQIGQIFVVFQQVQQGLTHGVDVLGR
jgi:hypothetical protein